MCCSLYMYFQCIHKGQRWISQPLSSLLQIWQTWLENNDASQLCRVRVRSGSQIIEWYLLFSRRTLPYLLPSLMSCFSWEQPWNCLISVWNLLSVSIPTPEIYCLFHFPPLKFIVHLLCPSAQKSQLTTARTDHDCPSHRSWGESADTAASSHGHRCSERRNLPTQWDWEHSQQCSLQCCRVQGQSNTHRARGTWWQSAVSVCRWWQVCPCILNFNDQE